MKWGDGVVVESSDVWAGLGTDGANSKRFTNISSNDGLPGGALGTFQLHPADFTAAKTGFPKHGFEPWVSPLLEYFLCPRHTHTLPTWGSSSPEPGIHTLLRLPLLPSSASADVYFGPGTEDVMNKTDTRLRGPSRAVRECGE